MTSLPLQDGAGLAHAEVGPGKDTVLRSRSKRAFHLKRIRDTPCVWSMRRRSDDLAGVKYHRTTDMPRSWNSPRARGGIHSV